jgi:hypothetical protein
MEDFEAWASKDPLVSAQRARATADDAAKQAKLAAKEAREFEAAAKRCPLDHMIASAKEARQRADNLARFARHADEVAKTAEARAKGATSPAPGKPAPCSRATSTIASHYGGDSLAAAAARYEAAEASAPGKEVPANNHGWSDVHAHLNQRLATGRRNRGVRR